jgi:hypothetical protein
VTPHKLLNSWIGLERGCRLSNSILIFSVGSLRVGMMMMLKELYTARWRYEASEIVLRRPYWILPPYACMPKLCRDKCTLNTCSDLNDLPQSTMRVCRWSRPTVWQYAPLCVSTLKRSLNVTAFRHEEGLRETGRYLLRASTRTSYAHVFKLHCSKFLFHFSHELLLPHDFLQLISS